MPLVVTSAAGANSDGYGALLEFDLKGKPLGIFTDDGRIFDPRRLGVNRDERLGHHQPVVVVFSHSKSVAPKTNYPTINNF
jgi:hypothetical protein